MSAIAINFALHKYLAFSHSHYTFLCMSTPE